MFGLDWRKMEEHMGGARNLNQIRHYYRTMRDKEPDMFSPEKVGSKTPKKRSSTAAGNSAATPKKKTKADESALAKTTPKRSSEAAAAAKGSTTPVRSRIAAKKSVPSVESDTDEEIDGKPPPLAKASATTTTPKTKQPPSAKKESSTTSASGTTATMDQEPSPMRAITDFFQKEEVQTVLAGILGFVVVFVAKKLME